MKLTWVVKQPDTSLVEFADTIQNSTNVVLYAYTESKLVQEIYEHFYAGNFYKRDGIPFLRMDYKWESNIETIRDHIYSNVI